MSYNIGEILPADMRSIGSGMLGILDNISLFVSLKTVPVMISRLVFTLSNIINTFKYNP